jgi:hypothetical protein
MRKDEKVNIACVIGNGPSRNQLDLHCINATMYTYGCNAIYRDFIPNYLISMDWAIVEEILTNDIHHRTNFYTQDSAQFNHMSVEKKERINWLKPMNKRLDSGNSALEVALSHDYDVIYMIGFDYNIDDKLPNVYHGTKNYARNSLVPAAESMAREWKQRLRNLIKEYPDTQIIRVNGSYTEMNIEATNYSEITIEQFKEIYDSRN